MFQRNNIWTRPDRQTQTPYNIKQAIALYTLRPYIRRRWVCNCLFAGLHCRIAVGTDLQRTAHSLLQHVMYVHTAHEHVLLPKGYSYKALKRSNLAFLKATLLI